MPPNRLSDRGRQLLKPTPSTSVFVNCPFDEEYHPLFRALVFTIHDCGFVARCAREIQDDGETRFDKLIRLIRESRFGIHDISRTELNEEGLPRFNMPYELGMFVGFRYSGDKEQQKKRLLVFDREPHRYQKFLSDYAGKDIHYHNNDVDELIAQTRHWLLGLTRRRLLGVTALQTRFARFNVQLPEILTELGRTEADLKNYIDFSEVVCEWIAQRPPDPI